METPNETYISYIKSETFATESAISILPTNNENAPKNGIKVNTNEIFLKLLPNSKFDMQIIKIRIVEQCTVHTHFISFRLCMRNFH